MKKKKVKEPPRPITTGPIPAPYLAVAPSPVSSMSRTAIDSFVAPTSERLMLPSTYLRSKSSPNLGEPVAPVPRRGYAANLAAPPLIMPGGTSAVPRIQGEGSPRPRRPRERDRDRDGEGRRRSEDTLRNLAAVNPSMASLGQLGRILETDPVPTEPAQQPQRRRRRVVREDGGLQRRLTVTTREEGRALGLARGASMRRLNVWDDLPESGDPPPPFPFPTTSTSRQPPTFGSQSIPETSEEPPAEERPRSPPPTWEQAVGLSPLPVPSPTPSPAPDHPPAPPAAAAAAPIITEAPPTPLDPPSANPLDLAADRLQPGIVIDLSSPRNSIYTSGTSSPTTTQYASAPQSPVESESEEEPENARDDRRLWNADLLAGYSLEQRIEREVRRKEERERDRRESLGSAEVPEIMISAVQAGTSAAAPIQVETPTDTPTSSAREANAPPAQELTPIVTVPVYGIAPSDGKTQDGAASDTISDEPTPVVRSPTSNEAITPSVGSEPVAGDANERAVESTESPTDNSTDPVSVEMKQADAEGPVSPVPTSTQPASEDFSPSLMQPSAGFTEEGPGSVEDFHDSMENPLGSLHVAAQSPSDLFPQSPEATLAGSASADAITTVTDSPPERRAAKEIAAHAAADGRQSTEETLEKDDQEQVGSSAPAQGLAAPIIENGLQPNDSAIFPLTAEPEEVNAPATEALTLEPASTAIQLSPPIETTYNTENLAPVAEGNEDARSQAGSDVAIAPAPPTRKLTRGKAIRRQSSQYSINSEARRRSVPSDSPHTSPRQPLFGETGFDWIPAGAFGVSDDSQDQPPQSPISPSLMNHRASAPTIPAIRSRQSLASLREPSSPIWRISSPGRRLQDPPLEVQVQEPIPASAEEVPIHREAAMKRRELVVKPLSPMSTVSPISPISPVIPTAKAPLVDLGDNAPLSPALSPRPPVQSPIHRELIALFDDESMAESSAQAMLRAEQEEILAEIGREIDEVDHQPLVKRRPPPPPPPLKRHLISTTVGANLTPRRSIIRTADSPITPRPLRQLSVGSQDRPTLIPTRRPPPPPPKPSSFFESDMPPSLPPRPKHLRHESIVSVSDTASSSSNPYTELLAVTEAPKLTWLGRVRPRGPRPPPPPPRHFARDAQAEPDIKASRPITERTLSDGVMTTEDVSIVKSPTRRSTSEQDLRTNPRSPLEYTDLDVLVSRLEGSGREYEGFSQITAFLGPGKSLAATPEALSTLLPGLISVDSRRTTAQGKVKLKLSLLGARVTKCPICLGQFKQDEEAVLLPECGHSAHEGCARKWFREDCRCFVCRVPLLRGQSNAAGGTDGEASRTLEEQERRRFSEGII